MTELSTLWLPILLSSVIVFVVSSVIHMALPWHKNDYPRVPNEDKVMECMRLSCEAARFAAVIRRGLTPDRASTGLRGRGMNFMYW